MTCEQEGLAAGRDCDHRNVQITVDFFSDLPVERHDTVCDMLRIWSLVGSLGGFRRPGSLRSKMDILPEDEPEVILDELSFCIRDNGVQDVAYNVLINIFARLAGSGIGIKRLCIG